MGGPLGRGTPTYRSVALAEERDADTAEALLPPPTGSNNAEAGPSNQQASRLLPKKPPKNFPHRQGTVQSV